MDRAFYSHESQDPDLQWLLVTFKERRPHYRLIENQGCHLILFQLEGVELNESAGPDKTVSPSVVVNSEDVPKSKPTPCEGS
jgi:hypothetical protein